MDGSSPSPSTPPTPSQEAVQAARTEWLKHENAAFDAELVWKELQAKAKQARAAYVGICPHRWVIDYANYDPCRTQHECAYCGEPR